MDAPDLDHLYAGHIAVLQLRLEGVLAAEGWDGVAIHSGSLVRRSGFDDQQWPLRVSPPFAHWLPLAEAECALLLRVGCRPTLLRPTATSFWEKPRPPESTAFEKSFDVLQVRDVDASVRAHLGPGRVAFVGEDAARAAAWGLDATSACPPGLVRTLEGLRTTKTPYEVACLAEANRRAQAGHDALRQAFAAGEASELDLHLLFLKATAQDDSDTPYKNIVALGAHAATLHHVAYARLAECRADESLLVDAGATCRGYGSDVTRTWVKGGGAAASVFAHLVQGVEAMQRRLCASVRVGMSYESLHDESHRQLGAILRDVGLVRGSSEEVVAAGVTRAFYPHGLGHSLGLQTHDVGCALRAPRAENAFLRNTSDVAVGQVFTIEPGVYFIDELLAQLRSDRLASALVDWKVVDAVAPLGGVRIEDDLHVERRAVRNLTREHLPLGGGAVG